MRLEQKIVVDIDNNELKKNNGLKIDLKINLDLKTFFKKINPRIKSKNNYSHWIKNFKVWRDRYPITKSKYFKQKKITIPMFL